MKQGTAQWLLDTELQKEALAVEDKIIFIHHFNLKSFGIILIVYIQ